MNDAALLDLLGWLDAHDYAFVPVTPLTHARVRANGTSARADVARRLFGWSDAVAPDAVPCDLMPIMAAAGILEATAEGVRSTLRVARLGSLLLHSAYPTDAAHSVFLGPDSYRFARLIRAATADRRPARILDIGTGAGVGALVAATAFPAARVTAIDVNPAALRLARINAAYAGRAVDFVHCDDDVAGSVDLAIANPPFIVDDGGRHYRHGGGSMGTQVALDMATSALGRLAPGGRLILYTGSPIVGGLDALASALATLAADHGATLRYDEIDPDIFGEELDRAAYAGVERIALVAAGIDL